MGKLARTREKEKKMKAEMSEKSFNQYLLKKYNDYILLFDFVFKFLVIGMGLATLIFAGLYAIAHTTYSLVCLIIFATVCIASAVGLIIWKTKYKKNIREKISQSQSVIDKIVEQETEKNRKMAEKLAKNSNK